MPFVNVENMRLGDMQKGSSIPEGVYHVRIGKSEIAFPKEEDSTKEQYPYLSVAYVVTGSSPEAEHGRQVFENLTFSPKGNFALRGLAEAIGLTEEDDVIEAINGGRFQDAELSIAVVVEKEGKGRDGKVYPERNKVVKRNPLEV